MSLSSAQTCLPPPAKPNTVLSNADILKPEFEDGSEAKFVCETGYTHAGGSRTVTCTAGTWSRLTMKCESKYLNYLSIKLSHYLSVIITMFEIIIIIFYSFFQSGTFSEIGMSQYQN